MLLPPLASLDKRFAMVCLRILGGFERAANLTDQDLKKSAKTWNPENSEAGGDSPKHLISTYRNEKRPNCPICGV